MTWLLLIYVIAVLAIGVYDARRTRTFESYVLADRKRSASLVAASMLATVVGASATLGVVDLACRVGPSAFWWLGSGALGLIACGIFLAARLRSFEVVTLADLVQKAVGPGARRAVAAIVVLGWTGIVAAQYVAAAKVVASLVGWPYLSSLVIVSLAITAYCVMGGQLSVMKTDAAQLVLMLAGIGICIGALYGRTGFPEGGFRVLLSSDEFPALSFWYFMIVVGSGFLVGPDVFARLFTARSPQAARAGALVSGAALLFVSAGIVSIGLWARHFAEVPKGEGTLPWILTNTLPPWFGAVFSLGLLSAIVSSADTCLLSAASTAEHDLLSGARVGRTRWIAGGIGLLSIGLAALERDIISTMLYAYSLFNCGVVSPVLVAVLAWPRRRLNGRWVVAAILCGGALGIAGKAMGSGVLEILGMDSKAVTLVGMAVSTALSLFGLWLGKPTVAPELSR